MNYDNILNEKIQGIKPSGIRKFFDILEEMGCRLRSGRSAV